MTEYCVRTFAALSVCVCVRVWCLFVQIKRVRRWTGGIPFVISSFSFCLSLFRINLSTFEADKCAHGIPWDALVIICSMSVFISDAWQRMTTKLVHKRQQQRHVGLERNTWVPSAKKSNPHRISAISCHVVSCTLLTSISRQQQQRYFPLLFYPWQCHSFSAINFLSVFVFCVRVRLGQEFLSLCSSHHPSSSRYLATHVYSWELYLYIQLKHNEEKWSRKWCPNKIDSGSKSAEKEMMAIQMRARNAWN